MPTRQPAVAGQFYDHRANTLRSNVEEALRKAAEQETKDACDAALVMLPHAGHIYCGDVVAATLTRTRLPETLVLLGPNHTGAGQPLSVWPEGEWITPLGPVPVDAELAEALVHSGGGFAADTAAHTREHCLEVLLPFLQTRVPTLRVVPVIVGSLGMDALRCAGEALAAVLNECRAQGKDCALVLSSDMHHFSDHENTCRLDALALQHLIGMDPEGLATTVALHNINMCGIAPAVLSLYTCKSQKISNCELVLHSTSGHYSGNFDRVVGYAGLVVAKNNLPNAKKDA